MKFLETTVTGVLLLELDQWSDERGRLVRSFSVDEFRARGLFDHVAQVTSVHSPKTGTMRGLHYQLPPDFEPKVIRCTRGSIHEVIIDVRPDSPTHLQRVAVTLRAGEPRAVLVPAGCAHGYLTLEDDTETSHVIGGFPTPERARGIRHDDPFFAIAWPVPVKMVSARDAAWPDFAPEHR